MTTGDRLIRAATALVVAAVAAFAAVVSYAHMITAGMGRVMPPASARSLSGWPVSRGQ